MTRRAVSDRYGAVLENERTALVGVAGKTWRFARGRHPQTLDARTAVRLVTRRTFHSAASEAMRVRFVAERRHLRHVARVAKRELRFDDEMRRARIRGVDRVTRQAVDRRGVRVHAGVT